MDVRLSYRIGSGPPVCMPLHMKNQLKYTWLKAMGHLANLAGFPSVVREGSYRVPAMDVSVSVQVSPLFTTVCVNGVDLYFTRLTGAFDGAAISERGCNVDDGA